MFNRLRRIAASLIAVVAVFWVYRVVAVPLIEPPVTFVVPPDIPPTPLVDRHDWLADVFPAGAWELDKPIVLESDHANLLIKEYQNLPDGRVRLTPCTIVFTSADADGERRGRPIVMRAGEALLMFDQPIDLRKAKLGKLVGGDFPGPITIIGAPTRPGANDAVHVVTRDVQMREDKIWTPHPVEFQIGPNSGRGRDLRIDLMPAQASVGGGRKRGPNVGGVQAFELARDVEMHLLPGSSGLLPGDRPVAAIEAAQPDAPPARPQTPVDIKCQGPFRFDMVQYVATFQDRVDVVRAVPSGPSDQMQCQLLAIHFAPKNKPAERTGGGVPALAPQRVEARGNPVVLNSPSTGGHARGERLEYDIPTGRVTLEGADEASLRQKGSEIHARSLVYTPAEPGQMGRLVAVGPGWLRGTQPGGAGTTTMDARFGRELRLRPHEGNQVVSLLGDAELGFGAQGKLSGQEIHVWLIEPPKGAAPPPANKNAADKSALPAVLLDRLLARGDVLIESPQLTGRTEQLEMWFKNLPPAQPGALSNGVRQASHAQAYPQTETQPPLLPQPAPPRVVSVGPPVRVGTPEVTESSPPAHRTAARPAEAAATPAAPKSHYRLLGDLIRVQAIMRGQTPELEDLSIDGNVDFVETQLGQVKAPPLVIRGDQLQVLRATSDMNVLVTGKPGHVEARGLTLDAANINLNRGGNRFWIDGPGRMKLPAGRGLSLATAGGGSNNNSAAARELAITWQKRMDFDGYKAVFDKEVVAQNELQLLRTETMTVTLAKRIDFAAQRGGAAGDNDTKAEVDQLACQGGAVMENRVVEGVTVTAMERIAARDLNVNQATGKIDAQGPGTLTSWRLGSATAALPGGGTARPRAPAVGTGGASGTPGSGATGSASAGERDKDAAKRPQLNYLNVNFQRAITGNVHQKLLVFNDQVKTVYGPVSSWTEKIDPDSPAGLGPRGVLLNTDQLRVNQASAPGAARPPLELEAIGNTLVEGSTFTARSHRLSYTEQKDLLVFEGDGRTDAQLYRQTAVGAPTSRAAARKILYWRTTEQVQVDDARFLDLNQIGTRPGEKPPATQKK